jgi:hypothetical protein
LTGVGGGVLVKLFVEGNIGLLLPVVKVKPRGLEPTEAKPGAESCDDGVIAVSWFNNQLLPVCVELL